MRKVIEPQYFEGDSDWIERHGDDCWAAILGAVRPGLPFSAKEVTPAWVAVFPGPFTHRYRQVRLVLANMTAMRSADRTLIRAGNSYLLQASAPTRSNAAETHLQAALGAAEADGDTTLVMQIKALLQSRRQNRAVG